MGPRPELLLIERLNMSRAFTLVELLVVIAIIVVLLSLLAPAMDSAIESAQRAVCASRLHNFGLAISHYTLDNKRKLLRVVSLHSQNANSIYPSVARNFDSQGPGQWSGEAMAPYIGGVDLAVPIDTARTTSGTFALPVSGLATGGIYGPQWYCPSNGKTREKDEGNQLSSTAPGTGSANSSGWMALDYAYF